MIKTVVQYCLPTGVMRSLYWVMPMQTYPIVIIRVYPWDIDALVRTRSLVLPNAVFGTYGKLVRSSMLYHCCIADALSPQKLRLLKLINTAGELNYLPTIAHESLSGIQKTMSLQPEPDTHPVPRVKAPWTVKATSWLMFLKLSSLPKGVYAPLDEVWARPEYGIFKGGYGAIMIVRYTDTPVGEPLECSHASHARS